MAPRTRSALCNEEAGAIREELRNTYSRPPVPRDDARSTPRNWDGRLLEEDDGDNFSRRDLFCVMKPLWTVDAPERFRGLTKARRSLHQAISTYVYIIHGQILSDDHHLPAKALWDDQLPATATRSFAQLIVDTNTRISAMFTAETLWGDDLSDGLMEYFDPLDESTVRLRKLVREIKLLNQERRLPDRHRDAPMSDRENKKWIRKFARVTQQMEFVMRVLFEKVAHVSPVNCAVVLPRHGEDLSDSEGMEA